MNKVELVSFLADDAGITKKDSYIVIDSLLKGVKRGLCDDGVVKIAGFGTFSVIRRKARKSRNPKTGAPINVPSKVTPKFKASPKLKKDITDTWAPQ